MSDSLSTVLKSPRQASDIFSQSGSYPKQKHVFMVEFIKKGTTLKYNPTYVVKSVDRPTMTMKTEELNQYNKKRIVYTGYKTNPIKISFYDSANGAAVRMWNDYSKYYFGDFSQNAASFGNDIYTTTYNQSSSNPGFGFNAYNGGSSSAGSQFYFSQMIIYHFYKKTYDKWVLINPRINSFDPDDLDYSQFNVSTINMSISYEAALLTIAGGTASSLSEFSNMFDGKTIEVSGYTPSTTTTTEDTLESVASDIVSTLYGSSSSSSTDYSSVLSSVLSGTSSSSISSSALSTYGTYNFGTALTSSLIASASGNSALATYLGISTANLITSTVTGGINSSIYAILSSQLGSSYGTAALSGALTASLLSGNNPITSTLSSVYSTLGILRASNNNTSSNKISSSKGINMSSLALGATNAANTVVQYGNNSTDTSIPSSNTKLIFDPSDSTYKTQLQYDNEIDNETITNVGTTWFSSNIKSSSTDSITGISTD